MPALSTSWLLCLGKKPDTYCFSEGQQGQDCLYLWGEATAYHKAGTLTEKAANIFHSAIGIWSTNSYRWCQSASLHGSFEETSCIKCCLKKCGISDTMTDWNIFTLLFFVCNCKTECPSCLTTSYNNVIFKRVFIIKGLRT